MEPEARHPHQPRAIVVGACGGIGRATTLRLAQAGYRVALFDQSEGELVALNNDVGTITETCVEKGSITNAASIREAFARIGDRWEGVDAVINAAGVFSYAPVAQLSETEWRRTIDTNLTGLFFVCQAAIAQLSRAGGGRIVNVLSMAARETFENQAAYCASKAGALAFTRVLALELRPLKIAVTSVHPGAVDTPLWDRVTPKFDRSSMLHPDDVARTILFVLQQSIGTGIDDVSLSHPAGRLSTPPAEE